MSNIYDQFFLLLVTISCLACSDNSLDDSSYKEHPTNLQGYSWIPKDTLQVQYLGIIDIQDYHPHRKVYLCRDWFQKKIIEINQEGEVLDMWDLVGTGPEQIGYEIYALSYFKDSSFVVLGEKAYCFYDLQGSFIKKIPHPKHISGLCIL